MIVLANGLGGTFHTWRHLYKQLAKRFRLVSWDYRGTHASAAPLDRAAIGMLDHVSDAEILLEHLNVERALFLGWSMGVQLNFELYRRRSALFAGIGVINGVAGRPLDCVPRSFASRAFIETSLATMRRFGPTVNQAIHAALRIPGLIKRAKSLGLVASSLDEEVFNDLAADFAELDFSLYGEMLTELTHHDAWDVLPKVTVPTTIIAGERDFMTPVAAAVRMSELIHDSELLVLPGCTHYAPVERPDLIHEAIEHLIARCGGAW